MKSLLKYFFVALYIGACGYGIFSATANKPKTLSEITIYRQCPECKGKKYVDRQVQCSYCSGEGCSSCGYRGYNIEKVVCPVCDGEGRVRVN